MDIVDGSYTAVINIVGLVARVLIKLLPANVQLRLRAMPAQSLTAPGWIWVQAVSVGELILAEGIIKKLLLAGYRVHVTTGTLTGFKLLTKKLSQYDSDRITGGAFPVDDYLGLRPFFRYPPGAFISIETEIWPNLLRRLKLCNICSCVINGRLTERSLSYGRPWLAQATSRLNLVVARDADSVKSFLALGAPNVILGGNFKTDLPNPKPLPARWNLIRTAWANYPVMVVGSTIDMEEKSILAVWHQVKLSYADLRLIIAPRQPNRFQAVADLLSTNTLRFHRASQDWPSSLGFWHNTDILLLDTIGELASVYGEGTIALVGGGWAGSGGHNPMEPIRYGLPTLLGSGYKNFEDLVIPLRNAQLLKVVEMNELAREIIALLSNNLSLRPAKDSVPVVLPEGFTGTLEKTWKLLEQVLPSPK